MDTATAKLPINSIRGLSLLLTNAERIKNFLIKLIVVKALFFSYSSLL